MGPTVRPRMRQLGSGAELSLKLADLALSRGELARAAGFAREALALEPDLHLARLVLAEVDQRRGDLDEARRGFEDVVRLHPRFAEGHLRLGDHLALAGREQDAIAAYRRAARCDGRLPMPRLNLALVYFRRGDVSRALYHFRAAVRIDPGLGRGGHGVGDYHTLLETLVRCGGAPGSQPAQAEAALRI